MSGDDPRRGSRPRSRRRRVIYAAAALVVIVSVVIGLLFVFQRSLIYLPDRSDAPPAAEVLDGGEDITLRTSDGLDLGAYLVRPSPDLDRDLAVLVAPGNAGHRGHRTGFADELTARGFTVLLLDYRGYGGNPGSPDEQGLHADGAAAVSFLTDEGFSSEQIIYFGESLGTGVVAGLLAQYPPAGLVLRSPFTNLPAMADHTIPLIPVGWLVHDQYPVREQVTASEVPVAVIRGDQDEVVPTELSAEVAAQAPVLVEELVLPGARHNDPVMFGAEVADVVERMADQIQPDG